MKPALVTERLQQLDPGYRNYIQSGMPVVIAETFSQAHQLNEDRALALENGFALYLLFFFNLQTFAEFISTECGLDAHTANLVARAMHQALPSEIQKYCTETWELISKVAEVSDEEESISSEIAETEAALEKVSPIRTMAGDSKQVGYSSTEEPTYTSIQSAIINEAK
jgi:hypothetical protein